MRQNLMNIGSPIRLSSLLAAILSIGLLSITPLFAADGAPDVSLDSTKAAPRSVEPLTQRSIVRDYKAAWSGLAQALEANSTGPLNALFEGTAHQSLEDKVTSQQRSGITSKYSNQTHRLQAVFYAPEGDVIELHDTAEYDIQILDGEKTIHSEHALVRYVVLMTPGADRWVIRQLQAVPQF